MPATRTSNVGRALERMAHHCQNCGILAEGGLCEECHKGRPLIQYATLLGEHRFYQRNGRQSFVNIIPREKRTYQRKDKS